MTFEINPNDGYREKLDILKKIERYIEDSIRESDHLTIILNKKINLIDKK